ncbi:hypothetical protein [Polaromonas sp. CG9_12]|nr:hypothetical protein [Polaromonas sp. CG9_12]
MRAQRLKQVAVVLAALVLIYAAAGFLLAPWLAEHRLAPWLQERLGRGVLVGVVRANPFLLTLEVRDVRIEGRHGSPVIAFDELSADLDWVGLFRRTWTLDRLALQGLRVHLVREPGGGLNLAELAQRLAGPDGDPGRGAQAAVLRQLDVPQASLVFTDLTGAQPASATLAPVSLQANGLSNMVNRRATHSLSATLPGGGALEWRGGAVLQPALDLTGNVQLSGLQAAALWPFVRDRLRLSEMQASANLSARYAYSAGESLRLDGIAIDLADVLLARAGEDGRLLAMQRITAGGGSLDVARRAAALATLEFQGGETTVAVAPDGRMNWVLAAQPQGASAAVSAQEAAPGWTLQVAALSLGQVGFHYRDRNRQPTLAADIGDMAGSLQLVLATGPAFGVVASGIEARLQQAKLQAPGAQQVALALGSVQMQQGHFDLQGRRLAAQQLRIADGQVAIGRPSGSSITPVDPAVQSRQRGLGQARGTLSRNGAPWALQVDTLQVDRLGAQMTDRSRRTPLVLRAGTIDGRARLRLMLGASSTQVALENLDARLQQLELAIPGIPQPPFTLASASIVQGHLDLADQRIGASELVLQGGTASIVRNANGRLALRGLLAPATGAGPDADRPASGPPSELADWRYAFGLVRLESLGLKLADRSFKPPLTLGATLQASARNVASDQRAAFEAALSLAPGGTVRASGTADPGAANVQAQVEVAGLALAPLQPLLARFAALDVRSGAVSASTQLRYQGGAQASLQAQGSLGIADLLVNEAWSGQRFLSWRKLDADGVAFDLASRRLTVQDVTVNAPGAKIEIAKDRSVNLAQVLRRGEPARQTSGPADAQPNAPAAAPWDLRVERVRLHGGEVNYADLSLVLPFSTTVKALDGTVVGISNDKSRHAEIQASGTIEPYGSASVSGGIAPFAPAQFTDLHVEFNNVLVPPLSPYTATFAGRKVKSGKLWLDLEYKIAEGELRGNNAIRLADFTLGERVQAPSALSVPLDLAVALLTDAKGEIHLSVPVRGDLGNPSFGVASAVRQALGNVLQRVVSAPFRALARLFGGNAESLAAIDFEPGSAALRPEQREKLDALSRALQERPRLQLVVSAPYNPQTDALALRREQAKRALAQTLGRRLEANEDPGPIAYDDPATRRALEQILREQAGVDAVRQLNREFAGASDAGRRLYEAMFEQIAATRAMGESATQLLAAERARAIAGYLVQQGVGRERVQTGQIAAVPDGSTGAVSAQLQVAAAGATG